MDDVHDFDVRGCRFRGLVMELRIAPSTRSDLWFEIEGVVIPQLTPVPDCRTWWQKLFDWGAEGMPYDGPRG